MVRDECARGEDTVAVLAAVEGALREHGRLVLSTLVRTEGSTSGKPGWRLLVAPDGSRIGNLGGGAFEAMVVARAGELLGNPNDLSQVERYYLTEDAVRGEATGMVCGGMVEVFMEVLSEPPMLVVCGAGPVGQALARGGALAGFRVLVADDREQYRRPELFPEGTRFCVVDRGFSGDFLGEFRDAQLFVAVVSRCWETDLAALASLIRQEPSRLRYLGLMGSDRKIERVKKELAERDCELGDRELRAPIGLPIGGDSPGEIAIAIVAEMLQVRYA